MVCVWGGGDTATNNNESEKYSATILWENGSESLLWSSGNRLAAVPFTAHQD